MSNEFSVSARTKICRLWTRMRKIQWARNIWSEDKAHGKFWSRWNYIWAWVWIWIAKLRPVVIS
ncbi:hypothetical protein Hanom_Chr03g00270411 [Helianthus anomalus]